MSFLLYLSSYLIIAGGIGAVCLSGWLAWKFFHVPARFGRAIAINCFAEMIAGIATLIFSLWSVAISYEPIPPWIMVLLRIIIFAALAGGSLHMYRAVRKTLDDAE